MKSILIIEDDPFLSQMYAVKLSSNGFNVDTAEDGEAGFKKLKDKKFDLVLLDLVLPKLDGFGLLKLIRKDQELKTVKVVVFSNLGQKQEVERALGDGADEYIIKAHFTPTEVLTRVKEILN